MRVMISQPMNGLTAEQIREKRAEVVAALEAQGCEVVDTVFTETPPENDKQALWYLGKVLQVMSTVDAVYFMDGWEKARGCRIVYEASKNYHPLAILNVNHLEVDHDKSYDVVIPLRRRCREGGVKSPADWCIVTFHGEPDIHNFGDVMYHFKQFCEALGIARSYIEKLIERNPEDYTGGMGPGGYFRFSLLIAQKGEMFVSRFREGITRLRQELSVN